MGGDIGSHRSSGSERRPKFYLGRRWSNIFGRVGLHFWADTYNFYSSIGFRDQLGAVKSSKCGVKGF